MKRFLFLASFVLYSLGLSAASESSQRVEAAAGASDDFSRLIRVMPSKTYSHVAAKCLVSAQPSSLFSYKSKRAVCFLVGHDDQSISGEMLQQCKVKDPENFNARAHLVKLRENFVSSQAIEESAKNTLFLAVIQFYFTFTGQGSKNRFVLYDAYDLCTNAYTAGHCELDKSPCFGIFKPREIQAYDTSTEVFENYLVEHDAVGFSFCPEKLTKYFAEV